MIRPGSETFFATLTPAHARAILWPCAASFSYFLYSAFPAPKQLTL